MTLEQRQSIIEDTRSYLNRGYRSRERIAAKRERIQQWELVAESITAAIKPVTTFGLLPSKKIENCACNIVDLQNEIRDEIQELANIELEIGRAINELVADPTLKTVLEMRYLNYLKWEVIAVRLDITFRWVMTLHKRALEEISAKAR